VATLGASLLALIGPMSPARADLSPATGNFTVAAGGSVTETKTVGVPAKPPMADIEIAIDTTGSMSGAIAQAKAEATNLVNAVTAEIPDSQFAVVDFKDSSDTPEYLVRAPMTASAPTVQAAINAMSASGGGDFPEAYNLVFNKAAAPATGGELGWRTGSRKFLVVIGDAPPHGAVPAGYSGCFDSSADPHGLNPATELAGVASAQRTLFLVAVNTSIKSCYDQLVVGGFSGSASVLIGSSFSDQIVGLIKSASATVNDIHLEVASATPAPAAASWISFSPASIGPVTTPTTQTFTLTASVPTGTPAATYTFDIVALADGADIGHQTLTLVVLGRDGDFSCRASALRLGTTEPAVANPPDSPCKDAKKTVATANLSSGGLSLGVKANALDVQTDQTPDDLKSAPPAATDNGLAKATISDVTLTVGPATTIKATVIQSQAKVQCVAKSGGGFVPTLSGSSSIGKLTVNGLAVNATGSTTVTVAGVTLGINSQAKTATSLTQRALTVTVPGLPTVVVAEAKADFSGHPCGS
jgi:hypothetical protein